MDAQRMYINCDSWNRSESMANLTNIIFPEILESTSDTIDLFVEYGNCGIKSVSKSAFRDHRNIFYLSLERNQIEEIVELTFETNDRIEILKLNNNNLTQLKETIFLNLSRVQYLYLQNNQINFIAKKVFQALKRLTHLYLQNNKLIYFDEKILNRNIVFVNLSQNTFKYLDEAKFRNNITILKDEGDIQLLTAMEETYFSAKNRIILISVGGILSVVLLTIIAVISRRKYRNRKECSDKSIDKMELIYDRVRFSSKTNLNSNVDTEVNESRKEELLRRYEGSNVAYGYLEPRVLQEALARIRQDA